MRSSLPRFALLGCAPLLVAGCGLFDDKGDDGGPAPVGPRNRSSAALRTYDSCEALGAALRTSLSEQMRVTLAQQGDMYGRGGPMAAEDGAANESATAAGSDANNDAGRQEGVDFSGTNNQEAGVDEADFVKTDGYYVYTLNGRRLEIFEVPEYGQLAHRSTTAIEGHPTQMLQAGDRAVVFSNIYSHDVLEGDPLRENVLVDGQGGWYRATNLTKLTVLDITERSAPVVVRELYIEGSYQTAREVEGSVRVVSHAYMEIPGLRYWVEMPDDYWQYPHDSPVARTMMEQAIDEAAARNDQVLAETQLEAFIPQIYERQGDAVVEHPFTGDDCASFIAAEDAMSRGVTSIISLNLFGTDFSFDADHIVTNWAVAYASTDTMLIAEPSHDWWWYWGTDDYEVSTNVHRFDIGTPGQTVYTGSGRVVGTINGQFSLSVYDNTVRVASTTDVWNRWWMEEPPPTVNHVFVLEGDSQLDVVGQIGGIAEGERIWSSRFVGERAFLVTFRNIDPLFTIDLSDKSNPRLIGELKVPGVSTYIHPVDENHLLTTGWGGDENGLDWNVHVSLFDVSDFANPKVASQLSLAPAPNEEIGWQHSWSEATYEHKAFQYWAPKSLLAVPLSSWRYVAQQQANGEYWEEWEHSSRLQLITVDTEAGLSFYGAVDHSGFFADLRCHWNWLEVRRSIFMQDYVYAISDRGLTAHHLNDLTAPVAQSAMPGMADIYSYDGCW
jgi:uncharacterized secreted protein with C-terminal beta-propeller domain